MDEYVILYREAPGDSWETDGTYDDEKSQRLTSRSPVWRRAMELHNTNPGWDVRITLVFHDIPAHQLPGDENG